MSVLERLKKVKEFADGVLYRQGEISVFVMPDNQYEVYVPDFDYRIFNSTQEMEIFVERMLTKPVVSR